MAETGIKAGGVVNNDKKGKRFESVIECGRFNYGRNEENMEKALASHAFSSRKWEMAT